MNTIYRDGIEEKISGPVSVSQTAEGHTVESYTLTSGKKRYFVTLAGTHWCAHGDTIAAAVADALWKDPARRPEKEALVAEIRAAGRDRKITLNEFRLITGACLVGCRTALEKIGRDDSPATAFEVRDLISREWGEKLIQILGWDCD